MKRSGSFWQLETQLKQTQKHLARGKAFRLFIFLSPKNGRFGLLRFARFLSREKPGSDCNFKCFRQGIDAAEIRVAGHLFDANGDSRCSKQPLSGEAAERRGAPSIGN